MRKAIRAFHEDERGIEVLQAILLTLVAAVMLGLVKSTFPDVSKRYKESILAILDFSA